MNSLLYRQLDQLLARAASPSVLACEGALRVGAATLRTGAAGEISATTVVCDVNVAEAERLEALVAGIADEFGLETRIKKHPGSYSVRFTCPAITSADVIRKTGIKAMFARVLAR
jgi:hypothetical protein